MKGENFLNNLLNALLPNRAAPVLARVMKAHEGPGKNKYSCDVKVLTTGTLEETDRKIAEVPINLIWKGKKGKGVYAIPPEGSIVVVEFIGWNVAYPYISCMYSDEYEAGEFSKDQFVITDGEDRKIVIDSSDDSITVDNGKIQVILKGDKAAIKNGSKSLFTIIDTHIQNVLAMQMVGAPTRHVVSPPDIQKFKQDKTDLAELLEA